MSQYRYNTATHQIQMGIDRPLQNSFCSIFIKEPAEDAEDDNAPDFNPFTWFEPTHAGVDQCVHAVTTYMQKNVDKDVSLPEAMIAACKADCDRLEQGLGINNAQTFS